MRRSCYCAEPRETEVGQRLILQGWVDTRRDHGGVIFVDLRDRSGLVQVVFNPEVGPAAHELAGSLRNEFVIEVSGELAFRSDDTINPDLPTGKVELMATELEVLNNAEPSPFAIDGEEKITENVRLTNRYLDLRRPLMQRHLRTRHETCRTTREHFDAAGFIEVETPLLTRSTPEGARDYLVPSRTVPGSFFALPQSPQLFKQLLMIGGLDCYYQIARCFRDEDLRADRQPEFTQIDIEMSFAAAEDVMGVVEQLMKRLFAGKTGVQADEPFRHMSYAEAVGRYGSDAPDLRYGLELEDLSGIFADSGFKVFSSALAAGGAVKAIRVEGGAELSRKELDDLTELAVALGAKGMAWIKVDDTEWRSPIVKFLSDQEREGMAAALGLAAGDLVLFGAGQAAVVNTVLGGLRRRVAEDRGLIDGDSHEFVWVTDFPLVERDAESGRYQALHHPFTAPRDEHLDILESDPLAVRADAYDIVLNGVELGGGSVRIHRPDVQRRVFGVLGIEEAEATEKFGFLLEALASGAPPHAGLALGLDRTVAMLAGVDSIRDVIAFPKTQRAACLLTRAPSVVDAAQLRQLGLRIGG
ncbi:MAG: aspartate--tRNA ligase [Deltaproteobacteria bacterium]